MTSEQRLEELKQQAKDLAERIDKLEDQLNNAEPTTGLLGRWAKHPQYGDVLITMDRPLDSRGIRIVCLSDNMEGGVVYRLVNIDDLDFPDQTTRPQDVPVGEAWLVDADDGDSITTNAPAIKQCSGLWRTGENNKKGEFVWTDHEVTLITPLIPARPHGNPETVTTEEEYEALPQGSVVAESGRMPWVYLPNLWICRDNPATTAEMAGTTRHVLRWGR